MENSYYLFMVSLAIFFRVSSTIIYIFVLFPSRGRLPCAVASGSQFIVTHNVKDFKRAPELKVWAVTPSEFLTLLRRKQ